MRIEQVERTKITDFITDIQLYYIVCGLCIVNVLLTSSPFLAKKLILITLYNVCYFHFILAIALILHFWFIC